MKNYLFTSDRIGFRNWHDSDLDPFAQMGQDDRVMEFFPNKLTREQSQDYITKFSADIDSNGFGFFAVDELTTEDFIGFIGIQKVSFQADFTPCIEIGWRLKAQSWGKGLATEAAKRTLAFSFGQLQLPEVFSFTSVENKRSERVMQKIGMQKVGEFAHPKLEETDPLRQHVLYKIEK